MMRRKSIRLFLFGVLAMLLVGCENKETIEVSTNEEAVEVIQEIVTDMEQVAEGKETYTEEPEEDVDNSLEKKMEEAIWQENPNLFYEILGEKVEMSPYVEKDGVKYEIHEKGAICTIKDQDYEIAKEIEYKGNVYPVIMFRGTYVGIEFEEFTIPEQFKYVFGGHINAKNLIIPDTVEYFEFNCGEKFETIVMPEYLPCYTTEEWKYMFDGCINLESIEIPEGTQSLSGTFRDCTALKEVKLPNTLIGLMSEAFRNCKSLESIVIPEKVCHIGAYCFENCEKLTEITFPTNLYHIEEDAFSGCSSLEELVIPEFTKGIQSTHTIGVVFQNMPKLKKLIFPREVMLVSDEYIYDGVFVFEGCDSLEYIAFPVSMTMEEFGCLVSLPESVKTVEVPETLVSSFQEKYPNIEVLIRQ